MRICVLGGTRFIGRAAVDELVAHGHDVLVVHRGNSEPPGLPDVAHLHADRRLLEPVAEELARFSAEAVLDCMAVGAADTDAVLTAFPAPGPRMVVLSSMDVYRAYGSLHAGTVTDAVPIDEQAPLRPQRYPYRGQIPGMDDYEKQDVEERWLARGGTVLRLPMVFGPHDYQRREEFVLRRVRAGRRQIPFGAGTGLFTRGYVADVARGIRLAIEADPVAVGAEVINLGEAQTPTVELLARRILDAASAAGVETAAETELVRVPDDRLPDDLGLTRAVAQPLVVDSSKATRLLGWRPSDPEEALAATVAWHLEHPPAGDGGDFAGDDAALAAAVR